MVKDVRAGMSKLEWFHKTTFKKNHLHAWYKLSIDELNLSHRSIKRITILNISHPELHWIKGNCILAAYITLLIGENILSQTYWGF